MLKQNSAPKSRGFTLVELMVTLSIAAILATLALVSFKTSVDKKGQESSVDKFIAYMNFARTESIKRGTTVSLNTTVTNRWDEKFHIYLDANTDSQYNDGETIIRTVHPDEFSSATITTNNDTSNFSFKPNGKTTATVFTVTQGGSASTITLNNYGKIFVTTI